MAISNLYQHFMLRYSYETTNKRITVVHCYEAKHVSTICVKFFIDTITINRLFVFHIVPNTPTIIMKYIACI